MCSSIRSALNMCYLLDIDKALYSHLLLQEVKFNKSWNTFFAIKIWFYNHNIIRPFSTFHVSFIKSWFYSNLMEIEFYLNQRLNEKKNAGGELRTWHSPISNRRLRKHAHQGLTFHLRIFDEISQLSSSLKFVKAELYLIGGCQDK